MRRRSGSRVLTAVMFTDIVDSSTLAGRVGDRRWKEVIGRHHAIVRRALKRLGGRELDTAGDGFFANFGEPASAIRAACTIIEDVRALGLELRAGVHFGECEQVGGKLAGVSVVVGARVTSLGGPGDVLVTGTTRELVGGAGFGFEDRGRNALKGVEGTWQVFAVTDVDGESRPGPLPTDEAQRRLDAVQPGLAIRGINRVLVAAVIVVLATAALAIALLPADDDGSALERIPVDQVGEIDPRSYEIRQALDAGSDPTGIAIGDDTAWILRFEPGILSRVDLATGAVEPGVSTGGHPSAVGLEQNDLVWVLNGLEGSVVGIDPVGMTREKTIELSTGTTDLALGHGALWVTNRDEGTLTRIDLVTFDREPIDVSAIGAPACVAAASDALWVGGSKGVTKLDPGSLDELSTWALRFPAGQLVVGEGAVWATHLAEDHVTKIDETNGPTAVIPVGDGPLELASGGGAIWVTNSLDGTVSRIDPRTNAVRPIRVGLSPEGIAFGHGSVWVTVHDL